MRFQKIMTHACILLLSAAPVWAKSGVPDPALSTAELRAYAGPETLSLLVQTDGSGASFDQALAPGGIPADATITVAVRDGLGAPIEFFSFEDIWLEAAGTTGTGLRACGGAATADYNTDALGETVFANALFAGGQSTNITQVVISGDPLTSGDVALICNSPDVNGDGLTNLSDVGYFTTILFGDYDYAADFNYDGAVNLTDAGFMSSSMGKRCQ